MPRKSLAAIAAFPNVSGVPARIRPPADMPEEQAEIFRNLVASVDAEHFRRGDAPLLRQYVEAISLAEQAADELRRDSAVIDGKTSAWLSVQTAAMKNMVALSAHLRLAPQSRMLSRSLHTRRGQTPSPYALMGNDDE